VEILLQNPLDTYLKGKEKQAIIRWIGNIQDIVREDLGGDYSC